MDATKTNVKKIILDRYGRCPHELQPADCRVCTPVAAVPQNGQSGQKVISQPSEIGHMANNGEPAPQVDGGDGQAPGPVPRTSDTKRTAGHKQNKPARRATYLPQAPDGNTLPLLLLPEERFVPPEIVNLKRWVIWNASWNGTKWDKIPLSPLTGRSMKGKLKDNLDQFVTFAEARAAAENFGASGVGYQFVKADKMVGGDYDHCITLLNERGGPALDGEVSNWIFTWFKRTYVEVSVSGTGIHWIAEGRIPHPVPGVHLPGAAEEVTIELYDDNRFFTFSGHAIVFSGHEVLSDEHGEYRQLRRSLNITDCQGSIDKLLSYLKQNNDAETRETGGPNRKRLSLKTIREIHGANLETFRGMKKESDPQNDTLNSAAFFAARAFAAGALEESEKRIKDELLAIARSTPYCPKAESTLRSGWDSGLKQPLEILPVPANWRDITTPDEAFAYFNEKYFVVEDFGGQVPIVWLENNPNPAWEKNLTLGYQKPEVFAKRFNHRWVEVIRVDAGGNEKTTHEPIFDCWYYSKHRQQYDYILFAPGKPSIFTSGEQRIKNLWQSFAVKPRPGNCQLYLDFVRDVICSKNQEHYNHLIKWMAYAIQHPDEPGHHAIALRGNKGTGKNFFVQKFGYLYGSHFSVLVHPERVVGRFNIHLRNCSLLFINEALFAGNHTHENMLKSLITDDYLDLEAKFLNAEQAPNYLHVILASNSDWFIPASFDERRFFVLDVSDEHRGEENYFAAIDRQLEHGGYEALLHYLLNVDLGDWTPRQTIRTDALLDQIMRNLPNDAERAFFNCLHAGRIPGKVRSDGQVEMLPSQFMKWAKEHGWKIDDQMFSRLLSENPKAQRKSFNFPTRRRGSEPRYKLVPTLEECRKLWDKLRGPYTWPRTSDDRGQMSTSEQWESCLEDERENPFPKGRR